MVATTGTSAILGELDEEYEIERELGRGATGAVYLARHRASGYSVALKVIRREHLGDGETMSRLRREARLMTKLDHPHIVRLYDVRQLSDGHAVLVLQYVKGRSLGTLLQEPIPLALDEVEHIVGDVATALGHAHAHGVIHRDVKPHNILLDAVSGRAMLSDFGIAKAMGAESEVTRTGTALGTPAYMAPEQIDGREVDARADVYSLGLVAWQMLSGHVPWGGGNVYDILYRQKHHNLPTIAELRPDAPPRFALALDRALRKDPRVRWATMDAFVEQLRSDEVTSANRAFGDEPTVVVAGVPSAFADLPDPELTAKMPAGLGGSRVHEEEDDGKPRRFRSRLRDVVLIVGGVALGVFALDYARGNRESIGSTLRDVAARMAGKPRTVVARPRTAPPTLPMTAPAESPRPILLGGSAAPLSTIDPNAGSTLSMSSSPHSAMLKQVRALLRRPDSALTLLSSNEIASNADGAVYALRSRIYLQRKRWLAAYADAEIAERLGYHWNAQLLVAMIEARWGERRAARERIRELLATSPLPGGPIDVGRGSALAAALLTLGERDSALAVLGRVDPKDPDLMPALDDPAFDGIRGDARFRGNKRVTSGGDVESRRRKAR